MTFWQFSIATLFVYPKVALYVFVGSRAAALSDGEQRSHMDTGKVTSIIHQLLLYQRLLNSSNQSPQWPINWLWSADRSLIRVVRNNLCLGYII